ncbi:MAG TPA: sigma-54 dependent transcriptional regulator [Kofleriaceae bacterium]|nr:sigma-54 dependent transcriptional regulator [Kofleriaceae bacterium]
MGRILVVDDERVIRHVLRNLFRTHGFQVEEAETAAEAEAAFRAGVPDLVVVDYLLPDGDGLQLIEALHRIDQRVPLIMLTAKSSIDLAVRAVKAGAEQFVVKPLDGSVMMVVVQRALESYRDRRRRVALSAQKARHELDPFVGESPAIRALATQASRVLETQTPVLIEGETGTGKSVLATWLHHHGPRAQEALVDINGAGLSRDLLEAELFGHERGAFTGAATSKLGLLEVAHRGTVFLDEIGEIAIDLQPRLLKVLEEKQFRRIGDVRSRSVDIRLIAATNRDLRQMIREGRFRADLYFRINTIHLVIPPLRARPEDIPYIARHLLDQMSPAAPIELTPRAVEALCEYDWPGNVRELRNVLERAQLLAGGATQLDRPDLRFEQHAGPSHEAPIGALDEVLTLAEMERRYVEQVLRRADGAVDRAAAWLGIARSTLYQKLRRYRDSA